MTAGDVVPYHSANVESSVGTDAGFRGRAVDRPRVGDAAELVDAVGVRVQEIEIGMAALEHLTRNRERDRQIGAGPDGEVQVGLAGERGPAGIDDDELGAVLLRLLDVRDDVDPRRRRIAAPDDDQPGVFVVGIGDARHLGVHRGRGGAGRRRAQRPREP